MEPMQPKIEHSNQMKSVSVCTLAINDSGHNASCDCALLWSEETLFLYKEIKWFLTHNSFVDWSGLQNKKKLSTDKSDKMK